MPRNHIHRIQRRVDVLKPMPINECRYRQQAKAGIFNWLKAAVRLIQDLQQYSQRRRIIIRQVFPQFVGDPIEALLSSSRRSSSATQMADETKAAASKSSSLGCTATIRSAICSANCIAGQSCPSTAETQPQQSTGCLPSTNRIGGRLCESPAESRVRVELHFEKGATTQRDARYFAWAAAMSRGCLQYFVIREAPRWLGQLYLRTKKNLFRTIRTKWTKNQANRNGVGGYGVCVARRDPNQD